MGARLALLYFFHRRIWPAIHPRASADVLRSTRFYEALPPGVFWVNKNHAYKGVVLRGATESIRTTDLLLRREALYPAELRPLGMKEDGVDVWYPIRPHNEDQRNRTFSFG